VEGVVRQHPLSIAKWLWRRVAGKKTAESLILLLSRLADINLLFLAYNQLGILKYDNNYISGEQHVIKHVLKQELHQQNLIFFDVGANRGDYSKELRSEFPQAEIFAFEPNPYAFETLASTLKSSSDHCYCLGLGSEAGCQTIYTYRDEIDSQHASMYKDIFLDFHHAKELVDMEIQLTTIDEFCQKNSIRQIDFLKIDVEGYELDVLKGAKRMLEQHRIRIIQFEFNVTHVFSRVFLKDFYALLKDFEMYRLDTERLIHLPYHDPMNEIFQFQNFLAIHKPKVLAN
jgi:FkbM family methyltransferase